MTKEEFQQELTIKVRPGVKPSHLKKSKSADDIPSPSASVPLTKSKSQEPLTKYPYTQLISQQEELDKLKKETTAKSDTISLLRKKIADLEQSNPPPQLLQDQLKEKQKELESLRGKLEIKNQKLIERNTELDNSLQARYEALKDFEKLHDLWKVSEQETERTVEESSQELINQDNKIRQLNRQISELKLTKNSLQWEVDVGRRLAHLRNFSSESDFSYWKYALYSLLAVGFTLWLIKSLKNIRESPKSPK